MYYLRERERENLREDERREKRTLSEHRIRFSPL